MDSISSIPCPKRHKLQDRSISCSDENEDRISKLPDAILGHILSFLPAKDAERTGALSKRWKILWSLLPDLELGMPWKNRNLNFEDTFINLVEKTLVLRNGLPFRRLRLSGVENTVDFDRVYDIISTALSCGVEQLYLYFPGAMDKFRLPWTPLMNCRTLVELKLSEQFVLDVPMDVFFPTLKRLHLVWIVYSTDASLERLFSGCPVLEELHVIRCPPSDSSGMKLTDTILRLNVSMPSIKILHVGNLYIHGKDCKHELRVDAPNLEIFSLYNALSGNYIFENLTSIAKVELHIVSLRHGAVGDLVIGLLRNISAVKTLKLSKDTMRILCYTNDKVLPTFYNLVCLSLDVDEVYGWKLLPSFLESMPSLESLIFANGLVPFGHWRADWRKVEPFEFNWHAPEDVPACLLFKLQTIEIRNDGPLMKKELKLIKYLLANAMCLKTMKICRGKMDGKTRNKLASYRRGSDSCQIILLKRYSAFWSRLKI